MIVHAPDISLLFVEYATPGGNAFHHRPEFEKLIFIQGFSIEGICKPDGQGIGGYGIILAHMINPQNTQENRLGPRQSRERETIINKVNDAIKSARHNLERLTTLKKASLRFLTLAHGDKEIAKRFMLDAYKSDVEVIEEHFESWTIQHVTDKMSEG